MESISPNQNHNCIALASQTGYRIFSLRDLNLLSVAQKMTQPVRLLEMYYLTNVILLVFEKTEHEIVVWDDQTQSVKDILTFDDRIHRMILRDKRLYVLTASKTIEIIDIRSFTKLAEIHNVTYFKNMCLEIPSAIDEVVAWNCQNSGIIKLASLHTLPKIIEEPDVSLHKNHACRNFVLNRRGTHLASNSKGTIIKLYDLKLKTKKSFALNLLSKEISCLFFVPGQVYLIVVEDSGHVKVLDTSTEIDEDINASTNIFQKITRESAWMNFSVPLKKSRVCYNEANKCLFFYSADKDILQYEVSFKDKTHSLIRSAKLEVGKQ